MQEVSSSKKTTYILLHIIFLMYSLGAVCSKMAATQEFLSVKFFFFYGLLLLDLFVYAIVWQQMLKRLPLITAYANKAVTVIWGMLWGFLLFAEQISVQKVIGAGIIVVGICLVVTSDGN